MTQFTMVLKVGVYEDVQPQHYVAELARDLVERLGQALPAGRLHPEDMDSENPLTVRQIAIKLPGYEVIGNLVGDEFNVFDRSTVKEELAEMLNTEAARESGTHD